MAIIFDTAELRQDTKLSVDHTSWVYNGLDICVTHEIFTELQKERDLEIEETYQLERDMQGPILEMNISGLLVDKHTQGEVTIALTDKIDKVSAQLMELIRDGIGYPLVFKDPKKQRMPSPQETTKILYDIMGMPVQRKRDANNRMVPTSDRAALERLLEQPAAMYCWPILNHMLLLRDLIKQRQSVTTEVDPDNYFRASYNIAGTNTGRLASSKGDFGTGSNAQNISSIIRHMYIAEKGKVFVSLDLEQVDSRNVGANCWQDFVEEYGETFAGSYLDACESGDLHTVVTKMARPNLGWPDDEVLWREIADQIAYRDKTYRDLSKGLGHGTNYMLTPQSAAKKIKGLPVTAAIEFQNLYMDAFPCIRQGHQRTKELLLRDSCLYTLFGRRRHFFDRPSEDETLRAGVAFRGQGSSTDIINRGMLRLFHAGRKFPGFNLKQQVHDSTTFVVNEECVDEAVAMALEALRVPKILKLGREFIVPAEAKVGYNLGNFNDKPFDKEGRPLMLNPDGLKKYKGSHGDRRRVIEPRDRYIIGA